jgi:hypothetical protein
VDANHLQSDTLRSDARRQLLTRTLVAATSMLVVTTLVLLLQAAMTLAVAVPRLRLTVIGTLSLLALVTGNCTLMQDLASCLIRARGNDDEI